MIKKTGKNKIKSEIVENKESYEKLRDELFQYRVEIQSYKRSMRTLWACVSIVIAVLGFFGYNRIETLLGKVESNANARLARTDSLLMKVDTHFLDSVRTVVEERTASYEEAIAALENGTRVNNELYRKLISALPFNKRKEKDVGVYSVENAINIFDIVYYTESYRVGRDGDCYVVMGDEFIKEKDDILLIIVEPINRNIAVFYQTFEVLDKYNKLYFCFDKYEKYEDYTLSAILLRRRGHDYVGYSLSRLITLK